MKEQSVVSLYPYVQMEGEYFRGYVRMHSAGQKSVHVPAPCCNTFYEGALYAAKNLALKLEAWNTHKVFKITNTLH